MFHDYYMLGIMTSALHEPNALLVRNGLVYTANAAGAIHAHGSVLSVDGFILAVGDVDAVDEAAASLGNGLRVLDARDRMVLPGFVNAHWHELFARRLLAVPLLDDSGDRPGWFADGGDVQALSVEFDRRYGELELLQPDEAEAVARYSLWTQLRCGTTTLGDVGSINLPEAMVAAARAIGIRLAPSIWLSDAACRPGEERFQRTRDADELLAQMTTLLDECAADATGRIRAMPSVIYPTNMTDELGAGLRELVERYDTPFATHIGALRNEGEVVRRYYGATSIRRFDELGLLTNRLLAVHCAFFDEEERQLLIDAGVHVNHSPAKYGTSGESTLSETRGLLELRDAGLELSLSTDGVGVPLGGMPEAMRQAYLGHNEIAADNTAVVGTAALAMATRIAARGLRWDDEVGSLEVGKQADIVLVPIDDWRYLRHPRPLDAFITLGGSMDVETVVVAGQPLLEAGRLTVADEDELERNYLDAISAFQQRVGG